MNETLMMVGIAVNFALLAGVLVVLGKEIKYMVDTDFGRKEDEE